MKTTQLILQKTKALKLWFAVAVAFIVMLNVSAVEAMSLNNGDVFKANDGGKTTIRVVSSDEVEIDGGSNILLGKYTIDGERVRIVISGLSITVQYYKITPDGLVEEKGGRIFYSSRISYLISADGTEVTDQKTGLIWQRCAVGMQFSSGECAGSVATLTYKDALQYAAAQVRRTGIAWRVPTKDELFSIVDTKFSPTIDPTTFPETPAGMSTPASVFWTASPYADGGDNDFWYVSFDDGSSDGTNRSSKLYVRLVRGSQQGKAQ